MTRLTITQTSFAAGELDPVMRGRVDLRAHTEGAAELENVVILATGGLTRRPGTRFLATVADGGRLASVPGEQGDDLVVIGTTGIDILRGNGTRSRIDAALWDEARLRELRWAWLGSRLLLCQRDVPPQQLRFDPAAGWLLEQFAFATVETTGNASHIAMPFARFESANVTIDVAGSESSTPVAPGQTLTLVSEEPIFQQAHYGNIFRLRGRQVRIVSALGTQAIVETLDELVDRKRTSDWDEAAFSEVRGWPGAVTVYQNRLVLGGGRDLPDWLWLSRSGRFDDFDLGTGLDDEGVAFRLTSEQQHRILDVFAGSKLQVFTSAGEWVVRGQPLTPTNVEVELQTRVGAQSNPGVAPVDVDGATLFVGRTGRDLREFLFTDTEQAYQAADLATLSRHLLDHPVAMTFEPRRRALWLAMRDGGGACLTLDRLSNVAGWTRQSFPGAPFDLALHAGTLHLLLALPSGRIVVALEPELHLDLAVEAVDPSGVSSLAGLDHLVGRLVTVVADGQVVDELVLSAPEIILPVPAGRVVCGERFTHRVVPLAPSTAGSRGAGFDTVLRPVRVTFRINDTASVRADLGRGFRDLMPGQGSGAEDITARADGWRRGAAVPAWRIEQDLPQPFALLAVSTEVKVND